MNYLLAFCVSFVYVGLKVYQQKNVIHNKYWWVLPTSMLIQICEVTIVVLIIQQGFTIAAATGLGAGLGAIGAMWLHDKLRRG